MASRIWIFDLDDTLHDASSHIFPVMNQAMNRYIMTHLQLDLNGAHALRQHYWQIYGATLKGLMRHHGINPFHFLKETHAFLSPEMIKTTRRLKHTIQHLSGKKYIFTNAPRDYAIAVIEALDLQDCFELVFSVESVKFHAKPSVRGFNLLLNTLNARAADCVLLEDNLAALMTAKRLGMTTVWVSRTIKKPIFVDYRISAVPSLLHLTL